MATQEVEVAETEFRLPLNSRRLTGATIKRIAQALDVPITASTAEILQMVEAKLSDVGREPRNVQVLLGGAEPGSRLALEDETGTFLEIPPEEPPGPDEDVEGGAEGGAEDGAEEPRDGTGPGELETLREELAQSKEQTEALQEEVRSLQEQLGNERNRYKSLWKINCESAMQYDVFLSEKDNEIGNLKRRIAALSTTRTTDTTAGYPAPRTSTSTKSRESSPSSTISSASDRSSAEVSGKSPLKRMGKAPPVDQFHGEGRSLKLDEWLPTFERAATWNAWTEDDKLLQLAGHLRGRALQEWSLLQETEKQTVASAVEALRNRLDPGSKILGALEFKHMQQQPKEGVCEFITRLEKAFREAYGREPMSSETRSALLFAQLQDGLRYELVRAPAVSGAVSYEQLCIAAKGEERRLAALRKRQELEGTGARNTEASRRPKSVGAQGNTRHPRDMRDRSGQKICYVCKQPGHFGKDCHQKKSESTGERLQSRSATRSKNPSTKQVQTQAVPLEHGSEPQSSPPECSSDPLDYLCSSDGEGDSKVNSVRIKDTGSKNQYANVDLHGVPVKGMIDSGADITIIGGDLFKQVATVAKLKKKDFRVADKTPRTYDRKPFVLHGCMDLDITFRDKTMSTPVYIKMDSSTPLLLSEGVCRQLGILTYHPSISVAKQEDVPAVASSPRVDEKTSSSDVSAQASVPMVRVSLVQAVKLLSQQTTPVKVELPVSQSVGPLLVQSSPVLESQGVYLEEGLVQAGAQDSPLLLSNRSGFTLELPSGSEIGLVSEVDVVSPVAIINSKQSVLNSQVGQVEATDTAETLKRKDKLLTLYQNALNLPSDDKKSFCKLLADYHVAFSLEGERGETDMVQLHIDTGDAPPRRQAPRRMPFMVRREIEEQVQKMLAAGVIKKSHSPWASPVILVRKRNGDYRFCVDYRKLNEVTKKDTFPLPRIDDLLDQLAHSKYFSSLDLAAGYWQIQVAPDSQSKTAFVTHRGLFEFRVMPFGLTNAPAVFQRLVQEVLEGLNPEGGPDLVTAYLDDILIFSETLQDHMSHLKMVMDRIVAAGLKLNPSKCKFIQQEVEYLGHVITPQGLKTAQRHLRAVEEFPVPTSVSSVRQFLGLASYYRRFVKSFAMIASPLHALTKKNTRFQWTQECQHAFDILRQKLIEAPVMAYPSFDKEFILETDASVSGLGAVLSQVQEDGLPHPVAYGSRATSPSEKNYGITDLETLAVVWSLSHFKPYLYGQRVKIYTDHTAVKAVLQNPMASGKHARWWSKVYESGIGEVEICYRRGRDNQNADALSRCPQDGDVHNEADIGVSVFTLTKGESISGLLKLCPDQPDKADVLNLSGTVTSLLSQDPTQQVSLPASFVSDQRKDPECKQILAFLQQKLLPDDEAQAKYLVRMADRFAVVDSVLYYIDPKKNHSKRAVIPKHLQRELIEQSHSGPFAGHFSGQRTYSALHPKFWWSGMFSDIQQFCKSCPQCTTVSGGPGVGRPPLQPIPVQKPFQLVGVDIMDLPKTESGNKHVLVFQDFLSKWPMVFPIPDQKTIRIVDILVKEIVPLFGVPEGLLSDRGTNLLSFLMRDVCAMLGTTKVNTTAYHPRCNGLVERFNRTLKQMLRKHVEKYGKQWDTNLHGVLWAYRNTPHESTGEKPSFLLFGVDLKSPSEAALLPPEELEESEVTEYREQLALTLREAREQAALSIQQAQSRYKKYYDQKTTPNTVKRTDWVMIRFPQDETGKERKLSRPWHGPYRVLEVTETGILAEKVYAPQDRRIQVHLERVTRCPSNFPSGYYWYGSRRQGPGRPPKWLVTLQQQCERNSTDTSCEDPEPSPNESLLTPEFSVDESATESDTSVHESENPDDGGNHGDRETVHEQCKRTRTRTVKPPIRLMTVDVNEDARVELP